ncbi:glycosyl transferase family 41-domain-containing protein [Cryomyces antarcticus]
MRQLAEQQMHWLPQQYAHPLQRKQEYSVNGLRTGQIRETPGHSGNMLRRKTPNGTLLAAYDGTSQEQGTKPHAVKHILLPVSAGTPASTTPSIFRFGASRDLLRRSNGEVPATSNTSLRQQGGLDGKGWDASLNFALDTVGSHWTQPQNTLPQMDSMLNQMPMHQTQIYYPYNHQTVPSVLQPSFHSPAGPTASNDQGPYGPYWPNGTFVPYRPAVTRDPRYYPRSQVDWSLQSNNGYTASDNSTNYFFSGATQMFGEARNVQGGPFRHVPLSGSFSDDAYQASFERPVSGGVQSNGFNSPPGLWQTNASLDGLARREPQAYQFELSYTSDERPPSLLPTGQSTPRADSTLQKPISDFGPSSANIQQRDRIFMWALDMYKHLLAFIHRSRKNNQRNGQINGLQQSARPNIFPKPPRHPSADTSFKSPAIRRQSTDKASQTVPVSLTYDAVYGTSSRSQSSLGGDFSQTPSSSLWPPSGVRFHDDDYQRRSSLQQVSNPSAQQTQQPSSRPLGKLHNLRHTSGASVSPFFSTLQQDASPSSNAVLALESITKLCQDSQWQWINGIHLGGCLAYGLGDYQKALRLYSKVLDLDSKHVEAMSNLAATLFALNRKQEAEKYWLEVVKFAPGHFEAVEHLVGLLCTVHRGKEAVKVIEYVERSLRHVKTERKGSLKALDRQSDCDSSSTSRSPCISETSDKMYFDFDAETDGTARDVRQASVSTEPGFGSSGYAIPGSDNGRILSLIHAKGNMLYALGDNLGAARAFEDAVLISAGRRFQSIQGLVQHILSVVTQDNNGVFTPAHSTRISADPILLPPDGALQIANLCFPYNGELPGLKDVPDAPQSLAKRAAISTTSNSLLSLAKILQDGMSSIIRTNEVHKPATGVRDILALYYLSLALQPSPSTANNVGILLAGIQQSVIRLPSKSSSAYQIPQIPGVIPGSGVALALAYYNYGLNLDARHAHLYTNLGSLLKDLSQLQAAIKMYEQAVSCDPKFDIALANLANAVKDQGRISDAIVYYKRAVESSPDFAEAVCGLANALNSVCSWQGRGGIVADCGTRDRWHVNDTGMLLDAKLPGAVSTGWIKRVVEIVEKQLSDGENWGRGVLDGCIESLVMQLTTLDSSRNEGSHRAEFIRKTLDSWRGQKWEGARSVRIVERATRRIGWQWYQDKHVKNIQRLSSSYTRPQLPATLTVPTAPTVLPFHTFTCPMSAKQIRLISQRNGLRISSSTLRAPWLPNLVYPPPAPPNPFLRVGYVSSDFNNHPLAHLMQSVFGLHSAKRVKAFCYATTASDNSVHRQQIEREAPVFHDASSWPAERLLNQIIQDGIHILVNLNGYTRGARNEIFAARPAPIQMSFMGFAGTLGAEWCDYLLADETAVPPETLRPWRRNVDLEDQIAEEDKGDEKQQDDWVYGENIVFCRDTFFCCDHRQSAPDAQEKQLNWEEEQKRRWEMRKGLFPQLPDDAVIFGNFNQLYKIDPTTFRTWLRILAHVPNAVLWLLRFPDLGESHLRKTALDWAGAEVASRVLFTDVAPKSTHIARARVCDLVLDTPECNAHTTAADVLWSGTPLLTLPRHRYKMCSRMAASILKGVLPKSAQGKRAAEELIVGSDEEYEEVAVRLGRGLRHETRPGSVGAGVGKGRLVELRKLLYEARWTSALFDTRRWVSDLEDAYEELWRRWVAGEGGDVWLDQVARGPRGKG